MVCYAGDESVDARRLLKAMREEGATAAALRRRFRRHGEQKGFLPHGVRWAAWPLLLGVDGMLASASGLYDALLRLGRSPSDTDIRKDIGRTMPRLPLLRSSLHQRWKGPGLPQLYRILTAFAHLDVEVGYTQGMSFVAAMALIVGMPEEVAFFWLVGMMYRAHLAILFKPPLSTACVAAEAVHALLKRKAPRVAQRMAAVGMSAGALYSVSWLLSCFASSPLPTSTLLVVFDHLHCQVPEAEATAPLPEHVGQTHSAAKARLRGEEPAPRRLPSSQPARPSTPADFAAAYGRRLQRLPPVLLQSTLALVLAQEEKLLRCSSFDTVAATLTCRHVQDLRSQWGRERVLAELDAVEAGQQEGPAPAPGTEHESLCPKFSLQPVHAASPASPALQESLAGEAGEGVHAPWLVHWGGPPATQDTQVDALTHPVHALGPPRRWSPVQAGEGQPLVEPACVTAAREASAGPAGTGTALQRGGSTHPAAVVLRSGGMQLDEPAPDVSVMVDGLPCLPWMLPRPFAATLRSAACRFSASQLRQAVVEAVAGMLPDLESAEASGLPSHAPLSEEWPTRLTPSLSRAASSQGSAETGEPSTLVHVQPATEDDGAPRKDSGERPPPVPGGQDSA